MRFVLDINIIISALIKENSLIRAVLNVPYFEFFLPNYAIKELKKNENIILEKSGLNKEKLKILIRLILSKVKIIDDKIISPYYKTAEEIIGKIDVKDIHYIALALAIKNDGIWTSDIHFQRQDKIKIFTTKDILEMLA
ncbi:MAG: PIN domain-containing protein [Candidatus Pacearchaeota archaeon]